VTDRRVVFSPNIVDRLVRARPAEWANTDVVSVRVGERTTSRPLSGGLRHRLVVQFADGSEELFVVNHVERLADRLRSVLGIDR
jgi:hypothetical protein